MREIIPERLWIGNAADARDVERVLAAGVAAVVDLAIEEPPAVLARTTVYCRFPIVDGQQDEPGVLRMAIDAVASLLRQEIPTLVTCGAGLSRAPAVAAAAISIVQGGSADERLQEIVSGHPHDISPRLWEAIRRALADRS
jgi:hypothetical protein